VNLLHRLEAAGAGAALALLRALPPAAAAGCAGRITRTIGPYLPISRVAEINLRLALPALDGKGRQRVIRDMWWNLGCTVGELAHLASLHRTPSGPGWEIEGEQTLRAVAARGGPAIFFSGHIGNWELLLPAAAACGIRIAGMYRAAANPAVDAMINSIRRTAMGGEATLLPKGAAGARGALAHLANGGFLAILADQKMNDGISVPFFDRPAMTASALAALAFRFCCPVIPAHVERLGRARLRVIAEPPLELPATGDRATDIATLTRLVNAYLERWIRARPEDWLWLHRRYAKEEYGRATRR
jgi:Kdo2-lipid IVA lauroyltransferase/acyltransferase